MKLCSSVLVISALGVALSGCGGSGSQGNETPPSGNIYTGVVIDGPLQGATVFADINRNGVKDPGEPETVTDANGKYSLRVTANIYQPPVIVDVPPSAIDADTGQAVGKYYRMEAPAGVYSVINPITTMIKGVMDINPSLKQKDAEKIVRGYLELSDSYEIYADYMVKDIPSGVAREKWAAFLAESGRTHNIARIAAVLMSSYWENAKAAYGSVPPDKVTLLNSLFAEATLKKLAPLAASLPNDKLVDLSSLSVGDLSVSREQFDERMRLIAQGVSVSLAQVVGQDNLHVLPFKTAAANYAHFVLKDGGSSNIAGQTITSNSSVLLSDLSETYDHSLQIATTPRKALFQGTVSFEVSTREDIVRDSEMVSRWRITRLPITGGLQRNLYDPSWLKNTTITWPEGSVAYKAIVKTDVTGAVIYEEDASRLYVGKLPEVLYTSCCGDNSAYGLRIGDLALRFSPPTTQVYGGASGGISFASVKGGVESPLVTKGVWNLRDTAVLMDIPSEYWDSLSGLSSDRLFSTYSKPNIILAQLGPNNFTVGWYYPSGRYAELVLLNEIAFNSLKNNLKW